MDPGHLARLARALERADVRAHDPEAMAALARALERPDPPVWAGRHGSLVGYVPGPGRRRLVEIDRRDTLVAACRWRPDGQLERAVLRTPGGHLVGLEVGTGEHPAWGASDRLWLLEEGAAWHPRQSLSMFQTLDYGHLQAIPPLAEPRRLPPQAGTAVLNLLAGLMKDQGVARVRYRGSWPSESLFTALLECFRYDPDVADPLERFLADGALDWLPAPHERHRLHPRVWVHLRDGIDKVVLTGEGRTLAFYRPDWQRVVRREPYRVCASGDLHVCALWALDRSLEDRLVLGPTGEVLEVRPSRAEPGEAAPWAREWRAGVTALIARSTAPVLARAVEEVMAGLGLEWAPVAGDFLDVVGNHVRVRRQVLDLAGPWVRAVPGPAERLGRAAAVVGEVSALLAPALRDRAQTLLEALPEPEQWQRWHEAEASPADRGDEALTRLIALIAAGIL